jgi:hypothetical protein
MPPKKHLPEAPVIFSLRLPREESAPQPATGPTDYTEILRDVEASQVGDRYTAETMRDNPNLDEEAAITELGVGEALVSCLDEKGRPGIVERAFVVPPRGQIGPLDANRRRQLMQSSLVAGVYEKLIDRESAYEVLKARAEQAQAEAATHNAEAEAPAGGGGLGVSGRNEHGWLRKTRQQAPARCAKFLIVVGRFGSSRTGAVAERVGSTDGGTKIHKK